MAIYTGFSHEKWWIFRKRLPEGSWFFFSDVLSVHGGTMHGGKDLPKSSSKSHDGSMVLLYMVTFTINIPPMLAYIPAPWILYDPMGMENKHDLSGLSMEFPEGNRLIFKPWLEAVPKYHPSEVDFR
jgi:hypothetical protein